VATRADRWSRRFETPLLIAALLVIPAVIFQESQPDGLRTIGAVLNWAIWCAFSLELAVMLWVVEDRRGWLREHPLEVVVVLLTPPFLLSATQPLRALRLLRAVRLLRLAPVVKRLFSGQGVRYASLLAAVTALAGGEGFRAVEDGHSLGDSIYWAIATMTTLGSDIYPETDAGKALSVAVMIVGIGFVALLTGAIAQRFLEPSIEQLEKTAEFVDVADEAILVDLREIATRLQRVESAVARRS
jgi:voltage-gated potassium channel